MVMANYRTSYINEFIGERIEEFLNECKKKSKNTSISYKSSLNKIFKEILNKNEYKYVTKEDIESLTPELLKQYFESLHEELNDDDEPKFKNATINKHMSAIKKFIRFLKNWGYIDNYDTGKLELITSYPDTREEIEMIPFNLAMEYANYFEEEELGLEKKLIIKLAIETALRAKELLDLKWSNFTEVEDGVIMKSHGYNKGKGNKEWIDKIDKEVYNELLQLKELGNTDKLFTITYRYLEGMMHRGNKLLNKTGINYSFHSFKKLAVTMCYLNNNNCIDTAMKKARHSNVNTTMRYLRLTNLNATGVMSSMMTTDVDLYKSASHELLLECLGEMRQDMLVILNSKINAKINK